MRTYRFLAGAMLWAVVAGPTVLVGGDKPEDSPKEQSVSPYKSKTHGALHVKSVSAKTTDWFMVFQNGKQLAPPGKPLLDSTVELTPGDYVVRVNRTERKVTIQAGRKATLLTGELLVEAMGDLHGCSSRWWS